jgi:hypothetical protein
MADLIRGRYAGAGHFGTRGVELVDRILASEGRWLHEVNIAMIEHVRDMLDITTPLVITEPPSEAAIDRLIEQVKSVGGTSYLAGVGGKAYMGEDAEERFAQVGLGLDWSDHQPTTGDSIVTLLMDQDEPMEHVLRRKQTGRG